MGGGCWICKRVTPKIVGQLQFFFPSNAGQFIWFCIYLMKFWLWKCWLIIIVKLWLDVWFILMISIFCCLRIWWILNRLKICCLVDNMILSTIRWSYTLYYNLNYSCHRLFEVGCNHCYCRIFDLLFWRFLFNICGSMYVRFFLAWL